MALRAGYVMTLPDGRRVADPGNHADDSKWARRMQLIYGARFVWGPLVKRPAAPKRRKA